MYDSNVTEGNIEDVSPDLVNICLLSTIPATSF